MNAHRKPRRRPAIIEAVVEVGGYVTILASMAIVFSPLFVAGA